MKRLVVFTGAGVSADSGIATFRDSDGLWANYRIEEVCTPEALARDRAKVVEFYNLRRRETLSKEPNATPLPSWRNILMFRLLLKMWIICMNAPVRPE